MTDLYQTRLIVYSAEAGEMAYIVEELPLLVSGTCVFIENSLIRLETPFYDSASTIRGYSCGYIGYSKGGQQDGAMMYFPYGQIPADLFEKFFRKSAWRITEEEIMGEFLKRPIEIFNVVEFKDQQFAFPVGK